MTASSSHCFPPLKQTALRVGLVTPWFLIRARGPRHEEGDSLARLGWAGVLTGSLPQPRHQESVKVRLGKRIRCFGFFQYKLPT